MLTDAPSCAKMNIVNYAFEQKGAFYEKNSCVYDNL